MPSEVTEARIVYDENALYIGIRLFDREPMAIGQRLSRRDEEPDADAVQVYLDPVHDGRSGAMFEVTAAGVQRDALIFNDASLDFSWDGVWDSAVTIDDRGWTAEIRIPFSQLRFADGVWGLNIARYIRRKNETDWLSLVPKRDTHLASRMAELTGLEGIRPEPRMEVVSHAVTRDVSAVKTSPTPNGLVGALGADAKVGLGTNLTLDATVNPDFAQVESDPAAINLTAFETFLEERRPFFTESAPLFQTFGNSGGAFDAAAPTLFYSRRIGQPPPQNENVAPLNQPTATPVLGAVKLDGGVGSTWKIAVLDAITGATTAPSTLGSLSPAVQTAPLTNYGAARVLRSTDRGGIGMLGTMVTRNLTSTSTASFIPQQALVGGADGYVFVDSAQQWVVGGQMSASRVSWTPVAPASDASGTAITSTPLSVAAAGSSRLHIMRGGSSTTTPSPPTTTPGGPPSSVPGQGPPTSVPGTPPVTLPGSSVPSPTVPGGTPPATLPSSNSGSANSGTGGNSGTTGSLNGTDNTGANRVVDLSLGRLDGWSANANVHRNSGSVRVNVDAWAISPGFETNDLGFLPRADIQGLQGQVSWNKFEPDGFTRFRSVGVTKRWARTFAGELQNDSVDIWTSATFLNYWSAGAGTSMWRRALDATVTRGGPSVTTPAGRSWWASLGTDVRQAIVIDAGTFQSGNDVGDRATSAWIGLTVKPVSKVSVSVGPTFDHSDVNAQYVATIENRLSSPSATPHYVFAGLHENDMAWTTRLNIMATARLSFQLYAQLFAATGEYSGFKELANPATDRFLRYGVDTGSIRYDAQSAQYIVQSVSTPDSTLQFYNPDFNPALLDVHAVVRWEWRRGSTLYVVWTDRRSGSVAAGPITAPGILGALDAPADNALAVKFTYWLGR